MHKATVAALLLAAAPLASHAATDCSRAAPATAVSVPASLAPLSPELAVPAHRPGGHGAVLSKGYGMEHSLDQVLLRIRMEGCRALPAAGYVKQTEFDNTPFRFNMTQGGKRMTADDFDAWLQANGYSAGRRVDPNAPATPALTDVLPVSEVPATED
ncbi:MAG: hypothetical protein GX538_05240 [Gammaproteobacteria bacterium]|nr:hypothetical protein [Gammaproteobacteria bacterium]